MAKAPTKPGARKSGPPGRLVNPNRGAGRAAPASAAATAAFRMDPEATPETNHAAATAHAAAVAEQFTGQATSPLAGLVGNDGPSAPQAQHPGVAMSEAQAVEVGDGTSTADASISPLRETDPELSPAAELEADIARIRSLRRPLGSFSQKLALEPVPGYHQHWFNDVGARIDEAKANGWAHVLDAERKPIKRAVGVGRDNGVLYAYAMKLPQVFWQEDIDARHRDAAERVDQLKASPFQSKPGQAEASDAQKFYSPSSGVAPLEVRKG